MRQSLVAAVFVLISTTAHAQVALVNNAGSTGTTINHLAKYTGAPVTAVITATTDISGVIGVVVGGAGTTGVATIAIGGTASCIFDASGVTAGDWVINSPLTAGDCADGGQIAGVPTQRVVGIAKATVASGAADIQVVPPTPSYSNRVATSWTVGMNLGAADIPLDRVPGSGAIVNGIECRPEVVAGGTATIEVWEAASGAALTSGNKLSTTPCNANTGAFTEQALGVAFSTVAAHHYIGIHAPSWPSGTTSLGSGMIQINYSSPQ